MSIIPTTWILALWEKGIVMITRNYTDEFGKEITLNVFYSENGTDAVYASVTRDGGHLGEFQLTNGRVYACRNWDPVDQRYEELIRVNPYDKVAQILVGDPAALIYLERFAELLGKIRGEATYGRRPSRSR